jgi:hypothetical protein
VLVKQETFGGMCQPRLPDNKYLMIFYDNPFHDAISLEFPVGLPTNHTLPGQANMEDEPGKRQKGSVMWSGLANLH